MRFRKTVKNLNRIRELSNILLKYGFVDIVRRSTLRKVSPINTSKNVLPPPSDMAEQDRWVRLRLVIEELGSTFIKLAQFLGNRPDVLPEGLIKEFEKLQSEVAPLPYERIKKVVEAELGDSIEELFDVFDKQPIGSASIGQVHRARLKSGENVVVKVQRPGVAKKVATDLSLLREFVRLTEGYFKNIGLLNPLEVVDTFEATMQRELDYTYEARYLEQFQKIYGKTQGFYVPDVYRAYSRQKVLTLEFISGCKITDVAQLRDWGLEPHKIAEKGINVYLKQIFEYGFFHADPHPGNIIVRPNGTIVLIDFGMVGKMRKHQKYAFAGVFLGLANQDAKSMALSLRRLATESDIQNMQSFEHDVYEVIEEFLVYDVEDAGMNEFTGHLQQLIYKYKLQLPGTVFLVLRALAILEGIGKVLHPNFEALNFIKPYGIKLLAEQFSFQNQRNELTHSFSQVFSLFYTLPFELKNIIKKLRQGELKANHELVGFEEFTQQQERNNRRLSWSIIAAALVLAGSLSLSSPFVWEFSKILGLPNLSFGLLSAAAVLLLWIFISDFWRKS